MDANATGGGCPWSRKELGRRQEVEEFSREAGTFKGVLVLLKYHSDFFCFLVRPESSSSS